MVHVMTSSQLPCPFWSIQVEANNKLVPIFSEWLRWIPKKIPHVFRSDSEIPIQTHGVSIKLCFQHLETSQVSLAMMLNCVIKIFGCHVIQLECASASICVAQNAPKMHASYLLFEDNWVALTNISASFQNSSFMSIKLIVMFNVSMKLKHSFSLRLSLLLLMLLVYGQPHILEPQSFFASCPIVYATQCAPTPHHVTWLALSLIPLEFH